MADQLERLKAALSDRYQIEQELGSGGMATVYLAEDLKLHRKVAVKVLRPDLAAALGPNRFLQEIDIAAKLNHPHILGLYDCGDADGFLYYVMPHIEGESLRDKLAKEGELPIPEAVRILRDIVDALSEAHEHGVVHRDIKPENVLLTKHHALVTDFGVAKAVNEATGAQKLTTEGVALGTPAYMSPEQAAADKHIDHRADIYAVGAVAYELLTGRPPFTGTSPQEVLAAHVTQAADPVTKHRGTVPPALAQLVMRCLEKKAADRWQSAEELLPQLEALTTPSGGITPTGTQPIAAMDYEALARRAHPVRVAVLFGLGSVAVLAVVYGLVMLLGLPNWVFVAAVALLVVALPGILLTGHHERQRALARTTGAAVTTPAEGMSRWLRWRRAFTASAFAFGVLGLVTVAYMAMRMLGIGPVGTLVASGVLEQQERLILAEFENATDDSRMGETITELLRIDLAQSPIISVLEPRQVGDVLERMQLDRMSPLTEDLARSVAAREGIKAYVTGDILSVGEGFIISARLLAVGSGDALVVARETADGPRELIVAVDRLSATLRERIGESLRSVRADPPLARVTTSSIEALRLYSQARRVADQGDYDRAIALLEQATRLDTTFAMAYRRLGAYYGNRGDFQSEARGKEALRRAYAMRSRLSDRERYHVEGLYASNVELDDEKAVTAYLALLEKYPLDPTGLNNISVSYGALGRIDEADEALRRAIAAEVAPVISYGNLIAGRLWVGDVQEADTVLQLLADRFPGSLEIPRLTSNIAFARHDWATAEARAREVLGTSPRAQQWARSRLAEIAQIHGQMARASQERRERFRIRAQRVGMSVEERDLRVEFDDLQRQLSYAPDPTALAPQLDRIWERFRAMTADREPAQRGYGNFISAFARAGQPAKASELLTEYRAALSEREQADLLTRSSLLRYDGQVALADGRLEEAAGLFRQSCDVIRGMVALCDANPELGEAYERAGNADSALAIYERFVALEANRSSADRRSYAAVHRRLGELYEERGDREKAVEYYAKFVELWKDADPELQPLVEDVRRRIARLVGEPQH
jgi:tetratricopeptide (TPR) repeat protein/tRNA A-37 threonylcarbamoyl transferase component Bud32